MCLLIIKPEGEKFPELEHLLNAEEKNKDGIGIAYADGKVVTIKKDFVNAKSCHEYMTGNLSEKNSVLIHLRSGTAGLIDEGNRHPFPITSDMEAMRATNQQCKVACAHNGVFFSLEKSARFSDSMIFISTYLSGIPIRAMFKEGSIRNLICNAVGTSRVALLKYDGQIVYFGNFTKNENGCYYSNDSYKKIVISLPAAYYKNGGYSKFGSENRDDDFYKRYNVYDNTVSRYKGKKSKTCDICLSKKKSKWKKELSTYVCQDCYKKMQANQSTSLSTTECAICSTKSIPQQGLFVRSRPQLNMCLCDDCSKNETWFRALLQQEIEMQEVYGGENENQ